MTDMDSHMCDCCLMLNMYTYGPNVLHTNVLLIESVLRKS